MELTKTKYQQTEVGLIPEDWEVKRIGEISDSFSGGTPSTSNSAYYNGNIHWISSGELNQSRIKTTKEFITKKGLKYSSAKLVGEGTLLVAMYGATAGVSAITEVEGAINQAVLAILPINNSVEYLFQYFKLNKQYIIDTYTQGGQPNLSGGLIKSVQIPLPPLPEQKAIAEVLSDVDRLIQVTEQKLAKKRAIKQGAMQKLLTPKEDWEVKKLGDFLDYEQPGPYIVASAEYNDNYNTPVLTAGKTFILGYTNEEFGIFENGPVIIFDDFTTATKFVDFNFKVRSSAMKILKKKNDSVNIRFIYDLMQQIVFPLGDHKRHWIGEYQHIDVSVPNQEEQGRIATILSDMDKEIELIEQQIAKYKTLKQGLMQELLTGKTRLTV